MLSGASGAASATGRPERSEAAIGIGTGGKQQHAAGRLGEHGAGDVERAVQVDAPGGVGIRLGLRHRRDGREMDQRVGPCLGDGADGGAAVGDVERRIE